MSRKSASRVKPKRQQTYEILPSTWNAVRRLAGLPLTGEPVAQYICERLLEHLESKALHASPTLRGLVVMIVEAWEKTHPLPPRSVTFNDATDKRHLLI